MQIFTVVVWSLTLRCICLYLAQLSRRHGKIYCETVLCQLSSALTDDKSCIILVCIKAQQSFFWKLICISDIIILSTSRSKTIWKRAYISKGHNVVIIASHFNPCSCVCMHGHTSEVLFIIRVSSPCILVAIFILNLKPRAKCW